MVGEVIYSMKAETNRLGGDRTRNGGKARQAARSRGKTRTHNRITLDTQRGFAMAKSATLQAENREIARRKLVSYRAKCDIFRQLLKIAESAESRLASVTALYEETISSGNAHDTMADQIIMLNDQVDKLSGIIEKQADTLDEVLWIVNELVPTNATIARVMSKRYLEPDHEPTFKEIADEMGYTEGHVKNLHLEGLDLVYDILARRRDERHG